MDDLPATEDQLDALFLSVGRELRHEIQFRNWLHQQMAVRCGPGCAACSYAGMLVRQQHGVLKQG